MAGIIPSVLAGKPRYQRKGRSPHGVHFASSNYDTRFACRSLAGEEGESTALKMCPAHQLSRVASEDTLYLLIQIVSWVVSKQWYSTFEKYFE